MPVETWDERFTSSLAGGDDARAAAYLLSSYLEWLGKRRLSRQVRRRRIAAVDALRPDRRRWSRRGGRGRPPSPRGGAAAAAPPPPPKPFRIVFPEGFTREQMARASEGRGEDRRRRAPRARPARPSSPTSPPRRAPGCRASARRCRRISRASSSRPPTTSCATRRRSSSSPTRSTAFCRNLPQGRHALRALEEPDAVRRAQDRLDGRAGGVGARRERPLVAAVIYNRLHDHMQLGIDATLRYGLHIPPTQSITQSELASSNPYNTRRSSACRRRRSRTPASRRCRRPRIRRRSTTSTTCASPTTSTTSSPRARSAFDQYLATHGYK